MFKMNLQNTIRYFLLEVTEEEKLAKRTDEEDLLFYGKELLQFLYEHKIKNDWSYKSFKHEISDELEFMIKTYATLAAMTCDSIKSVEMFNKHAGFRSWPYLSQDVIFQFIFTKLDLKIDDPRFKEIIYLGKTISEMINDYEYMCARNASNETSLQLIIVNLKKLRALCKDVFKGNDEYARWIVYECKTDKFDLTVYVDRIMIMHCMITDFSDIKLKRELEKSCGI